MDLYRPSGKLEPRTLVMFAVAAGIGALLAWPYQGLTRWIPWLQLNLITVAAFGFVVGGLMSFAVHSGNCRNRFAAVLFAVPASLAILAASYYWAYRHVEGIIAKERPDLLKDFAFPVWVLLRFESGWTVGRSGSGSEFNGWFVAAIWGVELLVMLGFGVGLAWMAASEPFCESCGMWTVARKLSLPGLSREAADGPISGGDLPALVSLQPADPGASRLVLTAESCPKCRQQGWLSVEEVVSVVKRGKTEEKTKKLLKNAALEPDLLARFLERAEQSAAAPAPAA
jgi:hypothetical protein